LVTAPRANGAPGLGKFKSGAWSGQNLFDLWITRRP
jgi:hypothetical protein